MNKDIAINKNAAIIQDAIDQTSVFLYDMLYKSNYQVQASTEPSPYIAMNVFIENKISKDVLLTAQSNLEYLARQSKTFDYSIILTEPTYFSKKI